MDIRYKVVSEEEFYEEMRRDGHPEEHINRVRQLYTEKKPAVGALNEASNETSSDSHSRQ